MAFLKKMFKCKPTKQEQVDIPEDTSALQGAPDVPGGLSGNAAEENVDITGFDVDTTQIGEVNTINIGEESSGDVPGSTGPAEQSSEGDGVMTELNVDEDEQDRPSEETSNSPKEGTESELGADGLDSDLLDIFEEVAVVDRERLALVTRVEEVDAAELAKELHSFMQELGVY